eukprot:234987-Rhodomonas_salina.2
MCIPNAGCPGIRVLRVSTCTRVTPGTPVSPGMPASTGRTAKLNHVMSPTDSPKRTAFAFFSYKLPTCHTTR